MKQVYLNGEFLAPEAARVSVFDRGFVFADGVYEVIPVYGKRLFRLRYHLERLQNSLDALRIPNPLAAREWQAVFDRLIGTNGDDDQYIYLQVTRGPAPRDHAFPKHVRPTAFAYAQTIHYPDPALLEEGVRAITVPDIRWSRCDIKAIALLPNVLMREEANAHGVTEAILIRDGQVTEGAASNVFIVRDGRMITPPKGEAILPGVTRDLVLELAQRHGVDFAEQVITERELFAADEVWMTSSTKEILPITRIDDRAVGTGRPGPMHARLHALYQAYKAAFRAGQTE